MIVDRDGINQKEVAASAAKDQPTTARIVELLQKKGFITKTMNKSDRRAFQLYATEEGKALINNTLTLEQQVIDTAVTGLTSEQLEQLRKMLELIYHNTGNTHQE
ncbi:Transcriptional regulator SlyA [compost metagenome]